MLSGEINAHSWCHRSKVMIIEFETQPPWCRVSCFLLSTLINRCIYPTNSRTLLFAHAMGHFWSVWYFSSKGWLSYTNLQCKYGENSWHEGMKVLKFALPCGVLLEFWKIFSTPMEIRSVLWSHLVETLRFLNGVGVSNRHGSLAGKLSKWSICCFQMQNLAERCHVLPPRPIWVMQNSTNGDRPVQTVGRSQARVTDQLRVRKGIQH